MKNCKTIIYSLFLTLILSSCSPFENSSLIESIGHDISAIFQNKPAPIKTTTSGGQIVGNIAGYRMNVGLSNTSARTKTCNSQMCMEVAISR